MIRSVPQKSIQIAGEVSVLGRGASGEVRRWVGLVDKVRRPGGRPARPKRSRLPSQAGRLERRSADDK